MPDHSYGQTWSCRLSGTAHKFAEFLCIHVYHGLKDNVHSKNQTRYLISLERLSPFVPEGTDNHCACTAAGEASSSELTHQQNTLA